MNSRTNTQTLKKHIRVFHIGLSPRDLLVAESMFRSQAALADHYLFGAPTAIDAVDIMFVNADDAKAMAHWKGQQALQPEMVAIMVSEQAPANNSHAWVKRPFSLRDCVDIINVVTSAKSQSGGAPVPPPTNNNDGALRILVVDDSFPARQFMKFKLEELCGKDMRLSIDFAESGEGAVASAQQTVYDLVFLDVVMPGIDGYDTCNQLKQIRPTRVAMLTSLTAPVDFQRGRQAGCDYYLTKPPHDTDLRTMLTITSFRKLTATK